MSPDAAWTTRQWPRVSALLDRALDRPESERVAFVEWTCRDEPALAREVLGLLAARQHAADFLDPPLVRFTKSTRRPVPARIGPYRVETLLGEGGMGRVYRARHATRPGRHPVAIKVPRAESVAAGLLPQFLRERRIVERLAPHPGIVRFEDAGATRGGQPYLVTEWIDGIPIDQACDQGRLSLEARVRLVRRVCQSVVHVHRRGFLHCDLKPANVLVGVDFRPILIDFGIAERWRRADDARRPDESMRRGTPRFISPEQRVGGPLTPRSDVYGLGVLLHLVLCGFLPPFGVQPVSPSTVLLRQHVGASSTAVEEAAAARGLDVRRLAQALDGTLDRLVSVALATEPAQRLPSVTALSSTLGRWLRWRRASRRRSSDRGGRMLPTLHGPDSPSKC